MTDVSDGIEGQDEPDLLGAAQTVDITRKRDRPRRTRQRRRAAATAPSRADAPPLTPAELPADFSGIEYVFEPHGSVKQPLFPYLRALWERRAFLAALAKSQLRGTRSSTTLGGIWGILDPLFQATIYYFMFSVIRGSAGRPDGFLFVLIASILLVQLSLSALTDGGSSIRTGSSLMLNSTFPRALLPLASIYKGVLKLLPSIVVIAVCQLVLGAPYHWGLLWLPVLFAIQVVGAIGLAVGTSTLTVYFRDASNLTSYLARILFFTTPIIIPLSLLEKYEEYLVFQPLYSLFANYQHVFFGDAIDLQLLAISAAWAVGLLVVGGRQFLRRERDFASRL